MKKRFQKKENLRIILLAAALILGATLLLVGGMLFLTRVSSMEKKYDKDDFADVSMEKGNDKDDFSDQRPALTLPNELPDDGFCTYLGYTFTYAVNPDGESCTVTGMVKPEEKMIRLDIPYKCDGYKVTAIGNRAFENSSFIATLFITNYVEEIGENAFAHCSSLSRVYVNAKVIKYNAFADCIVLCSVDGKAERIGGYAFAGCSKLSRVGFSPKTIAACAFSCCSSLRSFDFSEIDTLERGAFYSAGLETLVIGAKEHGSEAQSGITSIPDKAFYECPLRYVLIGGQIKTVGENSIALFPDRIGVSPQIVIFMEGVETVGSMRTFIDSCPSGTLLFLPSSLEKFHWDRNYGSGKDLKLFYSGSEAQFQKLFTGYPNTEYFSERTTVVFNYEYSKDVYYSGVDRFS